jgi:hypothetical protein
MWEKLKRIFRTRHVAILEENVAMKKEIAALKADNRALLNSLLEVEGFVPVDAEEQLKSVEARVLERMAQGPLVEKVLEGGQETLRIKDRTSFAIEFQRLRAEERHKQHSFRPTRKYR